MKTTPNLANEFHPVPKTYKAHKEPARIGPGKKTKAWADARELLKKDFAVKGVTKCEIRLQVCWNDNALGFAHIDKRNNLQYPKDLFMVVLACNPCHQQVERMPAKKMRVFLLAIIANREYT